MESHQTEQSPSFAHWAGDTKLKGLVLLILLAAVVALSAYTYLTLKQTEVLVEAPATITVEGQGEVVAVPDIATFSFSVRAEAEDANSAQENSAETMNAIIKALGDEGVEEVDIKTTSYNLFPEYEYIRQECTGGFCPPGERQLKGYSVNQTVSVKVREVDDAGDLISRVGELGATNISGLNFTIDDDNTLKTDAREMAIEDAEEKAEALADSLDVRLGRIVGFWEDAGGRYPVDAFGGFALESAASDDGRVAPQLPSGENTINSVVSITYEIK